MGTQSDKHNKWYGSYSSSNYAAQNDRLLLREQQYSMFRVAQGFNASEQSPPQASIWPTPPPAPTPGNSWWLINGPYSDPCPSMTAPPVLARMQPVFNTEFVESRNEFENDVIDGSYEPSDFCSVSLWEAKRSTYNHLHQALRQNDTLSSSEQSFYDSLQGSVIAQFAELEDSLLSRHCYIDTVRALQFEKAYLLDSFFSCAVYFDTLQEGTTWDSASIALMKDSISNLISSLTIEIDSVNYVVDSLYKLGVSAARTVNNGVNDTVEYQTLHKIVNEIYLKQETGEVLDDDDFQALYDIATKCYKAYGLAVFNARALISQFDTRSFEEYDDCIDNPSAKKEDDESDLIATIVSDPLYRLYPNPAGETIFLEKTGALFDSEEISLNDMQGRVLALTNSGSKNNLKQIDVRYLAQGMYLLRISKKGSASVALPFRVVR